MIVVLANQADEIARQLVKRWAAQGAMLLLPKDLSCKGWHYQPEAPEAGAAVLDGVRIPCSAIDGVLVRAAAVFKTDLPHIRQKEREYVAAEMTAFLSAWLLSLPCKVVNRPTASCLSGPAFRREQWIKEAAQAGIPVHPVVRTGDGYFYEDSENTPVKRVVVVGERCLYAQSEAQKNYARLLASAVGVSLLNAYFTGPPQAPTLVNADVFVGFDERADALLADAMLELLLGDAKKKSEARP